MKKMNKNPGIVIPEGDTLILPGPKYAFQCKIDEKHYIIKKKWDYNGKQLHQYSKYTLIF
jgi:hypothetical protein